MRRDVTFYLFSLYLMTFADCQKDIDKCDPWSEETPKTLKDQSLYAQDGLSINLTPLSKINDPVFTLDNPKLGKIITPFDAPLVSVSFPSKRCSSWSYTDKSLNLILLCDYSTLYPITVDEHTGKTIHSTPPVSLPEDIQCSYIFTNDARDYIYLACIKEAGKNSAKQVILSYELPNLVLLSTVEIPKSSDAKNMKVEQMKVRGALLGSDLVAIIFQTGVGNVFWARSEGLGPLTYGGSGNFAEPCQQLNFESILVSDYSSFPRAFLIQSNDQKDYYITNLGLSNGSLVCLPGTENSSILVTGANEGENMYKYYPGDTIYSDSVYVVNTQMIRIAQIGECALVNPKFESINISRYELNEIVQVYKVDTRTYVIGTKKEDKVIVIMVQRPGNYQLVQSKEYSKGAYPIIIDGQSMPDTHNLLLLSDQTISHTTIGLNQVLVNFDSVKENSVHVVIKLKSGMNNICPEASRSFFVTLKAAINEGIPRSFPERIDVFANSQSVELITPYRASMISATTLEIEGSSIKEKGIEIKYKTPHLDIARMNMKISTKDLTWAKKIITMGDQLRLAVDNTTINVMRCYPDENIIGTCDLIYSYKLKNPNVEVIKAFDNYNYWHVLYKEKDEKDDSSLVIKTIDAQDPNKEPTEARFNTESNAADMASVYGGQTKVLFFIAKMKLFSENYLYYADLNDKTKQPVAIRGIPDNVCPKELSIRSTQNSLLLVDILSDCGKKEVSNKILTYSVSITSGYVGATGLVKYYVVPEVEKELFICSGQWAFALISYSPKPKSYVVYSDGLLNKGYIKYEIPLHEYDLKRIVSHHCIPSTDYYQIIAENNLGKRLLFTLKLDNLSDPSSRVHSVLQINPEISSVSSMHTESRKKVRSSVYMSIFFTEDGLLRKTEYLEMIGDWYRITLNATDASKPAQGQLELDYKFPNGARKHQTINFSIIEDYKQLTVKRSTRHKHVLNKAEQWIDFEDYVSIKGHFLRATYLGKKALRVYDRYQENDYFNDFFPYDFITIQHHKGVTLGATDNTLVLIAGNKIVFNLYGKAKKLRMILINDEPTFFATLDSANLDNKAFHLFAFWNDGTRWVYDSIALQLPSVEGIKLASWAPPDQFIYIVVTSNDIYSEIRAGVITLRNKNIQQTLTLPPIKQGNIVQDMAMVPTHKESLLLIVSETSSPTLHFMFLRPKFSDNTLTYQCQNVALESGYVGDISRIACSRLTCPGAMVTSTSTRAAAAARPASASS